MFEERELISFLSRESSFIKKIKSVLVPNGKPEGKLEEMGVIKVTVNIGERRWQLGRLQRASDTRNIAGSISWGALWGMIAFISAFGSGGATECHCCNEGC